MLLFIYAQADGTNITVSENAAAAAEAQIAQLPSLEDLPRARRDVERWVVDLLDMLKESITEAASVRDTIAALTEDKEETRIRWVLNCRYFVTCNGFVTLLTLKLRTKKEYWFFFDISVEKQNMRWADFRFLWIFDHLFISIF